METKILFIGDIVGQPGVRAVQHLMPDIVQRHGIKLVIANAENAYNGSGLSVAIGRRLLELGVHVITLGDHCWRRGEVCGLMKERDNILRPANFPEESVGKGWCVVEPDGGPNIGVINVLGRIFMGPNPPDCPFHAVDDALEQVNMTTDIVMVDCHAEATSEKQAMSRYLDGRVSAVLGTHTHVATADACILPGGTAFMCDVGMTGPHESIIGRRIKPVLHKLTTSMPSPFHVAKGDVRLSGAIVTIDNDTATAVAIERVSERLV